MAKPRIGVIIGSTRPGRFGDKPAEWIAERAKASGEFEVEIVDLRVPVKGLALWARANIGKINDARTRFDADQV